MFKKLMLLTLATVLVFGCQSKTENQNAEQKSEAEQAMMAEKTTVENFTLSDYNGQGHALADYQNSEAIVLMFIATRCPVSNDYNERMAQLYADYNEKGVAFLGINSNKEEDVVEIKTHAQDNNLPFTILRDSNNVIANKLDASVTPEVYVLNPSFEILYHGRIDDSRKVEEVTSKDLRKALDQILAGEEVTDARTKAFGCSIKKIET